MTAMPFAARDDLAGALAAAAKLEGEHIIVTDEEGLRRDLVDRLAASVSCGAPEVEEAARFAVWAASQALGCGAASVRGLYEAMGKGAVSGFTVPAIDARNLTYETARSVFRAVERVDAGPVVFEIARGEDGRLERSPAAISASVLAAAVREGVTLPVLFQADHLCANAALHQADPSAAVGALRERAREAVAAGFFAIDVDAADLADPAEPTVGARQRASVACAAEVIRAARTLEPEGVGICVGAAIGAVNGAVSTPEDLDAFMRGLAGALGGARGPAKIAVRTSAGQAIDFRALGAISEAARRGFRLAVSVRGAAAALTEDALRELPAAGGAEVHLSLDGETEDGISAILSRLRLKGTRTLVKRHVLPSPLAHRRPLGL